MKTTKVTYLMLGIGVISQIITFVITKDSLLSFISGLSGVFSVVLCSERKISYYFFSLIQMGTFSIICFNEQLYGKLFEQLFYFITTIIGIITWKNNLDAGKCVAPQKIGFKAFLRLLILTCGAILIGWKILANLGGNQPFFDSLTTMLGICAQILMMLRYKENWILWFIVDVLCVILFINQSNWCMAMQYMFWTINTIYGFYLWTINCK